MTNESAEIKTSKKRPAFFWGNIGILFSGLAAVVLVIVMGVTAYALVAANTRTLHLTGGLENKVAQSQNMLAATQKTLTETQQSLQQVNNTLTAQSKAIADLRQAQQTNQDALLATEAMYLVKMGNDNLQFENDIPLAIKLLETADQDIAKLSDPGLFTVREAFAADLAKLKSSPQVDISGIYARLLALSNQIDQLPLINTQFAKSPELEKEQASAEKLSWWRRAWNSIKNAFHSIVVVRKTESNVPPFIGPEQQFYFYQNLHAELEKAEWGLLHRQPDLYRSSLQEIINFTKKYTLQSSPVTQQVLTSAQELQQIDVNPKQPTLNESLQALQTYLNRK